MKKCLFERIKSLLKAGQIVGRTALQRDLWPSGWTLEDTADLNRTLNRMIADGTVIEQRREVPGASAHPPAAEWIYSLAPDPGYQGKVRVLGDDGTTWLVYKNGQLIDEYPVD